MKVLVRALAALVCGGLLVCVWAGSAQAYCRLTTVQDPNATQCIAEGIPLAWDRRCISYTLHRGGASDLAFEEVRQIFSDSFATWSAVSCDGRNLDFSFQQTAETTEYPLPYFNTEAGNHNGIMFVEDWDARDHDPRAFALTTVWHDKSNGRIVDADMEINESRGTIGVCAANNMCERDAGCPDIDLQNVVTHELGHFLGLAHTDVQDATMFDSAPIGETCKQSLEQDDTDGICAAYPLGALPQQCDYAPLGGYHFGGPITGSSGCQCAVGRGVPDALVFLGLLVGALTVRKRTRPRNLA